MKNKNSIHNLDTLEKEIYRQQLISKDSAKKLEDDFNYLRTNFFRMTRNSIKKENTKGQSRSFFFDHVFSNDHVQKAVTGITDRITNHAADAINHLIDRLFKKHK